MLNKTSHHEKENNQHHIACRDICYVGHQLCPSKTLSTTAATSGSTTHLINDFTDLECDYTD